MSVVWLALTILGYAQASSFKPECTIPPPGTAYVSGPNTRGTTSILFNCLSIIFLCTWNIQHLNIPASRPKPESTIQNLWWTIVDLRIKTKWMIFTILVPEYLVGKAFAEMLAAKSGARNAPGFAGIFHMLGEEVSDVVEYPEWEEIHAYMANMGYFVVDFSDVLDDYQAPFHALADEFKSFHQSEISTHPSWNITLELLQHRSWALDNLCLRAAHSHRLIDLPDIPKHHLARLDRGDKLVKALALVQITYLVIQLVARSISDLPSAQLEIATLAFSASSIITYVLYWSRPQGVNGVCVMKAKKLPDFGFFEELIRGGPKYLWTSGRTKSRVDSELDFVPLPNDTVYGIHFTLGKWYSNIRRAVGLNGEVLPLAFGAIFGGMLFGGLHCLAWKFQYPTSEEALAWKICSILTTGLPIISIAPFTAWQRLSPRYSKHRQLTARDRKVRFINGLALVSLLAVYILARLFLMVEIFRSLFFLPPKAFIDTWSGSFPHFTR